MTTKPDRIYWDSCVFIDCLQRTASRINVLLEIIEVATRGQVKIVTSALSIAEVVSICSTRPVPVSEANKIKCFFENRFILLQQVDRATAELAADIGRQHKIRPVDAIHIATAIRARCHVLHTYDGSGDPTNNKRLIFYNRKIGNPALPIEVPSVISKLSQRQKSLDFRESRASSSDGEAFWNARRPQLHPLRREISLQPYRPAFPKRV